MMITCSGFIGVLPTSPEEMGGPSCRADSQPGSCLTEGDVFNDSRCDASGQAEQVNG